MSGYTIVFPLNMLPPDDWRFSSIFHEDCANNSKDLLMIACDILIKTGVLVSTCFIRIQRDLFNFRTFNHCCLSSNGTMILCE